MSKETKSKEMNTRFASGDISIFDNSDVLGQVGVSSIGEIDKKPHFINDLRLDMLVSLSPIQTREPFDPENNNADISFVENIRKNGVIAPVLAKIVKHPDQPEKLIYALVAGHRRVSASRYLGIEVIRAMVFPESYTENQMDEFSFIENHHRKSLSPIELANQLMRIKKNQKMSREDIAKSLNISTGSVSNHMALLDAPKELLELAKAEKVSASSVSRIMREVDLDGIPAVSQAILGGVGLTDAISLAVEGSLVFQEKKDRKNNDSKKAGKKNVGDEIPFFTLLFEDKERKAGFQKAIGRKATFREMAPDAKTAVAMLGLSKSGKWDKGLESYLGFSKFVQKRFKASVRTINALLLGEKNIRDKSEFYQVSSALIEGLTAFQNQLDRKEIKNGN